jgi:uncharacterized protein YjbI with pentapeptide repeats
MLSVSEARPTSNAPFVCECEKDVRSACAGETFYDEHNNKRYCVLHFPGNEKGTAFVEAIERKLQAKDFNFRGVWFPDEAKFSSKNFQSTVDFSKATFNARANFSSTNFKGANFLEATFNGEANFEHTTFDAPVVFKRATFKRKADFYKAAFGREAQAYFEYACFSTEADFRKTVFDSGADFGHAEFKLALFIKASFNAPSLFSNAVFAEEAHFLEAVFMKESEFQYAKFKAEANFSLATFETAEFGNSEFSQKANFHKAQFRTRAGFSYCRFDAESVFKSAVFGMEAYFSLVTFSSKVDFSYALFENYAKFSGSEEGATLRDELSLNFQHTRIEKPDHVSFLSLALRPNWFVNLDVRKLDFTDVNWCGSPSQELEALNGKKISPPDMLLAVVYRQLAVNAEDNHRYEEASRFRYLAMDLLREVRWRDVKFWDAYRSKLSTRFRRLSQGSFLNHFRRDWLYWLYWAASGYGERILRAFLVLIGIWLLFAWLYTEVGFTRENAGSMGETAAAMEIDEVGEPLRFTRALTYSLGVMSLQKPAPIPLTAAAYALVTTETILGPLQAALLALAIRRKFMR